MVASIASILMRCEPVFASAPNSFVDKTVASSSLPLGVCANEIENAKKFDSDHHSLMRLAVCLHQNEYPNVAFDIYKHIRLLVPDYSYVLVNMGVVYLKMGEVNTAREHLDPYLDEVGGAYGVCA